MNKKLIFLLMILLFTITLSGCKKEKEVEYLTEGTMENVNFKEVTEKSNYVKITMEDGNNILIELDPETAPITVENFQNLISEKFYDGLIFHRVIKDFMIQGGDPEGTGMGGSEKTIKGEFRRNGVTNNISHKRGVISMARNGYDMDSASSQFFIVHEDSTYLDGEYAAFGHVIAGMDTVDKIATVQTDDNDKPTTEQKIHSIRFVEITKED